MIIILVYRDLNDNHSSSSMCFRHSIDCIVIRVRQCQCTILSMEDAAVEYDMRREK